MGPAALDHKSDQTSVSVFTVPFNLVLSGLWFWYRAFLRSWVCVALSQLDSTCVFVVGTVECWRDHIELRRVLSAVPWTCAVPAYSVLDGCCLKRSFCCLVRGVRFLVVTAPSSLAHRQVVVQAKGLRTHKTPLIAGVAQIALQMNHSCALTLTTHLFTTCCSHFGLGW